MTILQMSVPRSGGFFLWKTIEAILDEAGLLRRSYVKSHPIRERRSEWPEFTVDLLDVDSLTVTDDGVTMDVDTVYSEPIRDVPAYLRACDHVWGDFDATPHALEILALFSRVVYLVRDPRDVLVSTSTFAFTPYWKRFRPHDVPSPADFIERTLETFSVGWSRNVESFLAARGRLALRLCRYEDLTANLQNEVSALAQWLGHPLSPERSDRVIAPVRLEVMAKDYPKHVHTGGAGRYQGKLTKAQLTRIASICGPTMEKVGYVS